jgi:hypothetical protein
MPARNPVMTAARPGVACGIAWRLLWIPEPRGGTSSRSAKLATHFDAVEVGLIGELYAGTTSNWTSPSKCIDVMLRLNVYDRIRADFSPFGTHDR